MNVRYLITLTSEERDMLLGMVQAGKGRFRRLKRAQILLAAGAGSSDVAIVKNLSRRLCALPQLPYAGATSLTTRIPPSGRQLPRSGFVQYPLR